MKVMLKKLSRSSLHLAICWCLLIFSTPAHAGLGLFFNGFEKARDWLTVNLGYFDSERDESEDSTSGDFLDIAVDPLAYEELSGSACHQMNMLDLQLNGIGSLSDYLQQNCDRTAIDKIRASAEGDEMDAVRLCKEFQELKANNACGSDRLYSSLDISMLVDEIEKGGKLREIRQERTTAILRDDLAKMEATAKLQTELATDPILVDELFQYFNKLIFDKEGNRKENYKRILVEFGFSEDFLIERAQKKKIKVSEFINTVFSCLPTENNFDSFDHDINTLKCSPEVGFSGQERDVILGQAKKNAAHNCDKESCDSDLKVPNNLYHDLLSSIQKDYRDMPEGIEKSIAFIDSEVGINDLEGTQLIMDDIFSYKRGQPGNFFDSLGETYSRGNKTLSDDELLHKMREKAYQKSLEIISHKEGILKEDPKKRIALTQFLESKTQNGILEMPSYATGKLKREIGDFFAEKEGGEAFNNEADLDLYAAAIQQLAVGQNMGDYFFNKEKKIEGKFAEYNKLLSPGKEGDKSPLEEKIGGIYQRVKKGEISGEEAFAELKSMGDGNRSNLWRSAGEFLSLHAPDKDPALRAIYGAKGIVDIVGAAIQNVDNPDEEERTLTGRERLSSIRSQTLIEMVKRSKIACDNLKDKEKQKKRYCSPLSDPVFGAKGLEHLLSDKSRLDPSKLINSGVALCLPILAEDYSRRLDAQGYDHFSPRRQFLEGEFCARQSQFAICGKSCGDQLENHRMGLNLLQSSVFGEVCGSPRDKEELSSDNIQMTRLNEERVEKIIEKVNEPTAHYKGKDDNNDFYFSPKSSYLSRLENKAKSTNGKSNIHKEKGLAIDKRDPFSSTRQDVGVVAQSPDQKGDEGSTKNSQLSPYKGVQAIYEGNRSGLYNPMKREESTPLTDALKRQKDELDPTTRALLAKYENMQKEIQRLAAAQEDKGQNSDELAGIEELLKQSEQKIKDLEKKLLEKEDVKKALASIESAPQKKEATPSPYVSSNRFPLPSASSSGASERAAPAPTAATPVASKGGGVSSFDRGSSSEARGRESTSDGYFESASSFSPTGVSERLSVTNNNIVLSLSEVKSSSTIVPAGTSPDSAVLDAKRPILIPIGDGQFRLYEPELTIDGEVVTENGEVKYKRVVIVADEQAIARMRSGKGRMPASLSLPEEQAIEDSDRDIKRLRTLNETVLDKVIDMGVSAE